MVFCHSKLQWHSDIKIKGGLLSFYLTYVIPNDTMYLRLWNPQLFQYDDVQVPKLEGRMHCGLLHWRNKSVVENSWHGHTSIISCLDFDMWTISCIPRILTLNMSMSVSFLCNFKVLPQNKLKHENTKLPYYTTTSYSLYSTCRLSSQLGKG
jgi:hypothetical protein